MKKYFYKKFLLKFKNKRVLVQLGLAFFVIAAGVFLAYKFGFLKFKADTQSGNFFANQAQVTYSDSQNQARTILSNSVGTQIENASYKGRVTNKDGQPLKGIRVKLSKWDDNFYNHWGSTQYVTYTDANGNYAIRDPLDEGAYTIYINYVTVSDIISQLLPTNKSLFGYNNHYYKYIEYNNYHYQYILPNQVYTYDSVLKEMFLLEGTTYYNGWQNGLHQPKIVTSGICTFTNGTTSFTTPITQEGVFRVYEEDMAAASAPYGEYTVTCASNGLIQTNTQKVNLNKRDDYYLRSFASIDFKDAPANPATINVSTSDQEQTDPISGISYTMTYKNSGHVENNLITTGLPAGNYNITATKDLYTPVSTDITLAAGETQNIIINMIPNVMVSGKLNSSNATPLVATDTFPINISIKNSSGNIINTIKKTALNDKDFVFPDVLPNGSYSLVVSAPYRLEQVRGFSISSPSDKKRYVFSIFPGCSFSGKIFDQNGNALNGATVKVYQSQGVMPGTFLGQLDQFVTGSVKALEDGYYELNRNIDPAWNASYWINVSATGFVTQTKETSCSSSNLTINNFNFNLSK